MKVTLGCNGLSKSWQARFPATVPCKHCGRGKAVVGFVAHEGMDNDDAPIWPRTHIQYVTDLGPTLGPGLWPHDCIAVAVYFCRECLEVTAKFNQV